MFRRARWATVFRGHACRGGPADDRGELARNRARGEEQDPRGNAGSERRAGPHRAAGHRGERGQRLNANMLTIDIRRRN